MQNKFFDLQNKLQNRVQGLNANLTANLSDGATRLRQQLLQNAPAGGASASTPEKQQQQQQPATPQPGAPPGSAGASGEQQYLRLPVESAKKLRWYDRQDLNMLIELHLREKHEVYQANAALREALRRRGVGDAQLEDDLRHINATVDSMQEHDAGVGEVLLMSAKAELERLQDSVAALGAQLDAARHRSNPATPAKPLPSAAAAAAAAAAGEGGGDGGDGVADAGTGQHAVNGALAAVLQALRQASAASQGPGEGAPDEVDPLLLADVTAALRAASGAALPPTADIPAGSGDEALRAKCASLEAQVERLAASLAATQQEAAVVQESADMQVAEVRARSAQAQQAQRDLLKVAQDGRLHAEARCEEAEGRAVKAQQEARQLAAQVQRHVAEAAAATTRATQAEALAQRSRTQPPADAARQAQTIGQQKARIAELEGAAAAAQRQLSVATHQVESLEARVAAAEQETARATADARDLETAAAERDELAARLAAAEARVGELRAGQAGAQGLRELAAQSEARRAQAEEELVSTAKLAAALEERLAAATADIEQARLEAQTAGVAASAALDAVAQAMTDRWEQAGRDRSRWPPLAAEEIENVEARVAALNAANRDLQGQLQAALAARDEAVREQGGAERRALAAQDAAERVRREGEQREQRLQAAAATSLQQLDEFRALAARLERERDVLKEEKEVMDRARAAAAAALSGAKRRTGSGGLSEVSNGGGGATGNGRSRTVSSEAAAAAASDMAGVPSPVRRSPMRGRTTLDATDLLYLKNVLLKFVNAQLTGRVQECEVLLPAVAALLGATAQEYRMLRESLTRSQTPLPGWVYQLGGTT